MIAARHLTRLSCISATLASGLLLCGAALAQDYPNKPVRMVVPNSAGTTQDAIGRLIGTELAQALGQAFVVENKPGAGGAIGYEFVAKAAADGYTMAVAVLPDLAILPLISKELRFDTLKDLPAFIVLADGRLVFGTATQNPWKSFDELIAFARANPGKLNFGASGAQVRLPMEAVLGQLGLNVVHVPYNGGSPYFLALAAGDVHMGFIGDATMRTLGEKFRALAVTGTTRMPDLPNVPTFAQVGLPQIRSISMSLNLPAGTPKAIVDKLYDSTAKVLQRDNVKAGFAKLRYDIAPLNPEGAARKLAEEARLYADIAAKTGIRPQ